MCFVTLLFYQPLKFDLVVLFDIFTVIIHILEWPLGSQSQKYFSVVWRFTFKYFYVVLASLCFIITHLLY